MQAGTEKQQCNVSPSALRLPVFYQLVWLLACWSRCQVWREGREGHRKQTWGAAPQHSVCSPASSPVLSHRLPQPLWLHVHEPISSLVHREAHGQPPQLHGHPCECSTDSECGGNPAQCSGFSVSCHHVCHGATLRSPGSPSRNQPDCPAQLSGK